jgi:NAD(P)H dehydrogenase (quinone)
MQKTVISLIHDASGCHTSDAAQQIASHLQSPDTLVHIVSVDAVDENWDKLHHADIIVFGCTTSFGTVSSAFKKFMESTDSFWYKQSWKNKFAAGFTVSPFATGDKLNTLQSLSIFAAQHSMHWISPGILPRFINNEQTEGQNRFASYLGLMIQSCNTVEKEPFHPGDLLTIELFAKRILDVTVRNHNQHL